MRRSVAGLWGVLCCVACSTGSSESAPSSSEASNALPPPPAAPQPAQPAGLSGFVLPAVPIPGDNPQSPAKVELGRLLFFDKRLSGDVSISCASCHSPQHGFGDGNDLCRGYPGTEQWRNCPSVINAAYLKRVFWDGSTDSLESQAQLAATAALDANGRELMMEERLRQIPQYVSRFRDVFGGEQLLLKDAWRAIASFERTLLQRDTPFDRYVAGEQSALPAAARRGLALFRGKAGCERCHSGPLLSDEGYHNLGVPPSERLASDALSQVSFRFMQRVKGVDAQVRAQARSDLGLYYRTGKREDMGKFRTPPLRYLRYTAPYMHNGTHLSLREVVDFYDAGGGRDPIEASFGHRTKSPLMQPLGLTDGEKGELVALLEAMSGREIRVQPPVLPAYAAAVQGRESP